jgi:hypothetical protein
MLGMICPSRTLPSPRREKPLETGAGAQFLGVGHCNIIAHFVAGAAEVASP